MASQSEIRSHLRSAYRSLTLRDFSSARKHALLARQSDPTHMAPTHMLAVADVILAAGRRSPTQNHNDLYAILQLDHGSSGTDMQTQFNRLSALLNPQNNKFPFSQEAFDHVTHAWSVLSDSERKSQYDNEIKSYKTNPENNFESTFWTVCPYCYHMYEYEKMYEERILRCQNCERDFDGLAVEAPPESVSLRCQVCKRVFLGLAVEAPPESVLAEGKEEYYWGCGVFPISHPNPCEKKNEKSTTDNVGTGVRGGECFVVEISDDSDEDYGHNKDVKGAGETVATGVLKEEEKEVARDLKKCGGDTNDVKETTAVLKGEEKVEMRKRYVKSVVMGSKKMTGKGIKRKI